MPRRRAQNVGCSPPASGSGGPPHRGMCPTARNRWRCAGTRSSTPAGSPAVRGRRSPEQTAEVPAGARGTGRLRRHVAKRIADGLPVSIASAGLLGWPAAASAFVAAVVARLPDPESVEILGIDETRRGKPRWTRDAETGSWTKLEPFETNFVDLAGPQGLLGQASGRTKVNVVAWLDERGQAWKDAVAVVAMDPCAPYRAAVAEALPHAMIVADHFHLVRLANQAVTDVRRRVTWTTHGRRGRSADPAWAQRRRLLRRHERLTGGQVRPLDRK